MKLRRDDRLCDTKINTNGADNNKTVTNLFSGVKYKSILINRSWFKYFEVNRIKVPECNCNFVIIFAKYQIKVKRV